MKAVKLSDTVFDISFHPKDDIVSSGLVDGSVHVHKYDREGGKHQQLIEVKAHDTSARCVKFDDEGKILYSAGADGVLHCMDAEVGGALKWRIEEAHEQPIHSMVVLKEAQGAPWLLATGDDQGVVKIWDTRQRKATISMSEQMDYISSMCEGGNGSNLLAASADTTLAVLNLQAGKVEARSDEQEADLQSICLVKGGRKVACGTQNGVVLLWSWSRWGDCSDRIPGHPQSVDAIIKLDEDALLTGCSDGLIRVVQVHPNKFLGLLGDHSTFPVERMDFCHDRAWLGTASHDNLLRFWDMSILDDDGDGDGDDHEDDDVQDGDQKGGGIGSESEESAGKSSDSGDEKPRKKRLKPSSSDQEADSDEDCESDGEDKDDDDDEGGNAEAEESGEGDGDSSGSDDDRVGVQGSVRAPLKTESEKFFSDL